LAFFVQMNGAGSRGSLNGDDIGGDRGRR